MRLSAALLAGIATLSACGRQAGPPTPLSPSTATIPVPANYAGAWHVSYRYEECLSRHCFVLLGQESSVNLRLTQIGDRVSGVVSGDTGYIDVTGTVSSEGRLSLSGGSTPGGYSTPGLVVDRLELERDPATGVRGYVRLLTMYDGDTAAYNGGSGGSITRGRHAPLSETFAGTWRGYYDTAFCTPGPSCVTERKGELELVLEQRAAGLAGELKVQLIPGATVSGTYEGHVAKLSGSGAAVAVTDLQVQRDQVGRLAGTLTLHHRGSTMAITLVRVGRLNDEL